MRQSRPRPSSRVSRTWQEVPTLSSQVYLYSTFLTDKGCAPARPALHVWTPSGAVRTSVTLLGQDIGNTRNSLDLVHDLILSSANWYRATKWRPDLSIIAPGRWVARMPGTGTLRRSSTPARKKAIVGKSRVAATRLQGAARISFSPRWLSWFMTPPGT